MAISISNILDVLAAHDIRPTEDVREDTELPGIGEIAEGETVYATSIADVFRDDGESPIGSGALDTDDPRVREWWEQIERIIEEQTGGSAMQGQRRRPRSEPPEPHCAWYCPIHFFGHGWGIYIREGCILSHAIDIATFVYWPGVRAP